jgi:hypothetical protein
MLGRAPARLHDRRSHLGGTGATLILALQLFCDLVEDLDAARLEHVPQLAQLVGVGLQIGKRREDLTGCDEPALANLIEYADRDRRLPALLTAATAGAPASSGSAVSVIVTTGFVLLQLGDPRYQLFGRTLGRIPMLIRSRVGERVEQST